MQKLFEGITWSEHLTVKTEWVDKFFHRIPEVVDLKIKAHALSLKFSGNRQESLAFAEYVGNRIENYVFDQRTLEQFKNEEITAYPKASSFFGNTNPVKDGKYGELILYLLVEAIFQTPMVCHKLTLLTNVNDQVKGGDGIFFGTRGDNLAILIGESKIYQSLSGAISSSLDSVDRFNQDHMASSFDHELFIARSNISKNFNLAQANALFKAFRPGTEEYQSCNKIFPVLLIYDDAKIDKIEEEATNRDHAEELISEWILAHSSEAIANIRGRLETQAELRKLFMEFFLIPMSSVEKFKKTLFKQIHGLEYKEPHKEAKPKASRKNK
ncbi:MULTISPECIES: HamA C-terminal domain-containing protein [Pseudomonas]|jgi:hypothetical protein|uniref:Anti-bacteriophage protein A/HamA C-terminal domain-containing protein n=1 Tax=Pseudomonas asplenii TaxID=53407 RepID=A0A1H1VU11_9PSED|nr:MULTISPECIES: DUF1837 domain-containing protein [Pseudomonas]MBD8730979.1 DUF1837 domain-containing protein [Pseudomonas sp. CFBP 13710]RYZ83840.1 MAG: DUF1837 domain-containing protein [Pseudomonadota bacterium]SDS88242.1 protein of unknown function [Pseudomonas asplenii]VVN38427.1 hypothetical protein PS634_05256 [Pseudomonas fluorescens]